jgi:hypothetical protein
MGGAGKKSAQQENGSPESERDGRFSTGDGADTRPSTAGVGARSGPLR